MGASILSWCVLASLLSLTLLGPAPSAGPRIQWRGEPGCVATERLDAQILALTGRPPIPVDLTLEATRQGDRWRVGLEVHGETVRFERTLVGRDCQTLTHAIALILAVQLDPVAVADAVWSQNAAGTQAEAPKVTTASETRPRVPAPSPDPSPPPRSAPPEPPPPADEPTPRPHARPLLDAALMAELGILPRGAAAIALTTGAAWPRARVEVGALVSLGPDGTAPDRPSVGGRFRLFTGVVRGCGGRGEGAVLAAAVRGPRAGRSACHGHRAGRSLHRRCAVARARRERPPPVVRRPVAGRRSRARPAHPAATASLPRRRGRPRPRARDGRRPARPAPRVAPSLARPRSP